MISVKRRTPGRAMVTAVPPGRWWPAAVPTRRSRSRSVGAGELWWPATAARR